MLISKEGWNDKGGQWAWLKYLHGILNLKVYHDAVASGGARQNQ
jgi:hypothetical protein